MNSNNQPCAIPIYSVTATLISDITAEEVRCSVKKKGQNQYEISYKPTTQGEQKLHVKVDGQHIRESPFPVTVVDAPYSKGNGWINN